VEPAAAPARSTGISVHDRLAASAPGDYRSAPAHLNPDLKFSSRLPKTNLEACFPASAGPFCRREEAPEQLLVRSAGADRDRRAETIAHMGCEELLIR
jgi:hypothetical protein